MKAYRNNQKQFTENQARASIDEVKRVIPLIMNAGCPNNDVKICNNSTYPIFDVIVLEGINTLRLNEGEHYGKVKYIRNILPEDVTCYN